MLRPLLFLTAVCGTISTLSTGTTSEEPWGPTNAESTLIDDVDTNTAIVTEVVDEIQKVTATGQSYPYAGGVEEHDEEFGNPTYLPDDVIDVTAKSTTVTNVKSTTARTKQIVTPMNVSSESANATNTTIPDSSEWTASSKSVTDVTLNTTHILQTIRSQRTVKLQENKSNYSSTNAIGNVTVNNLTTDLLRILNSSLTRGSSFQVDTSTASINTSTVKAQVPSEKSSLFLLDSTSPTSLPTTEGSEPTTTFDDSKEHTSPRPSLRVEDTLQASRIDVNIDRSLQRRKNINHAALWITIGFVVVLVSYIAVLVIYNRTRPDWQPSSQEYQRFEDEAPEISTATTGCSTDDDNVSNHSTDAMTQTHPFLETIGCVDREITGYYSDSEQLYRQ